MTELAMLREAARAPLYRRAHSIPTMKVQTEAVEKNPPDCNGRLREYCWWESGNITSFTNFMRAVSPPNMEVDSPNCEEYARQNMKDYYYFLALHAVLLEIGGCETAFPSIEEDAHKILERGRFYTGTSKMMRGRPGKCHSNSAELWERNHMEHDVRICTGYALSVDGFWRQHTWLVHHYQTATQRRNRIIETTVKRAAYFGYELTEEESYVFCQQNY